MKQAVVHDSLYNLPSAVLHLCFQFDDLHLKIIIFFFYLCQFFLCIFKLDLCRDELVFQIVHFLVFHFDIIFKGISLFLCLKIIICNVQGEKYISGVSALFPVSFAIRTFRYLVIQIGRYFLQIFLAFKSTESIYLSPINTSVKCFAELIASSSRFIQFIINYLPLKTNSFFAICYSSTLSIGMPRWRYASSVTTLPLGVR